MGTALPAITNSVFNPKTTVKLAFSSQIKGSTPLQQDLANIGRQITQPSAKTRSFLGMLVEWFAIGGILELGESFVQSLLHLLQPLFENLGEILLGLFN